MLFMVIERFRHRDAAAAGARFQRQARRLPAGVVHPASGMDTAEMRCFQIMESPGAALLKSLDGVLERPDRLRGMQDTDLGRFLEAVPMTER
jgi:hypothetical protein